MLKNQFIAGLAFTMLLNFTTFFGSLDTTTKLVKINEHFTIRHPSIQGFSGRAYTSTFVIEKPEWLKLVKRYTERTPHQGYDISPSDMVWEFVATKAGTQNIVFSHSLPHMTKPIQNIYIIKVSQ